MILPSLFLKIMTKTEMSVLRLKAESTLHLTKLKISGNQGLMTFPVTVNETIANLSFFILYALINAIVSLMFSFSP